MYMLDTNVVSELRKVRLGRADANVAAWNARTQPETAFLSVVSVLELELGVLLLERRDPTQGMALRRWLEGHVLPTFAGRLLPVDTAVARRCAALHAPHPRAERDALIAATALVHGMTVVTRNVVDFRIAGLRVENPWEP